MITLTKPIMIPKDTFLNLSTDVVLFSIRDEQLQVLLVNQDKGYWQLPGGSLAPKEDLDASALRHLHEQTGIADVYLEQLYTFGRPDRDPEQRVVSVTYYALVPPQQRLLYDPVQGDKLYWFPVSQLPLLKLNHAQVVTMAHKRLAAKLAYSTIALQFMPEQFTLSALQSVYETILGAKLDKRNFRKRVLAMDCIKTTGQVSKEGNHRPARLYQVKQPGKVEFIK